MELNLEAMRSTIVASLPIQVRWTLKGTPLDYDFSVAHDGLRAFTDDMEECGDKEWLNLLIFGKSDYAEGGGSSPWLGIHKTDGAVYGLDFEQENPMYLLNSSIEHFIKTFDLLNEYLGKGKQVPPDLDGRVRDLDPKAYPGSDWRFFVEFLTAPDQENST